MTSTQPFPIWSLKTSTTSISTLGCYDLANNGKNGLMVARDDSSVEVYQLDINNELQLASTHQMNEGVTAIQGGRIQASNLREFVISTFSGRIIGFHDAEAKYQPQVV